MKRARRKVADLEAQKEASKAGRYLAPQAPELAERYDESERDRLRAQIAVNEANDRRNEVYDDPEASEDDRLIADMDLIEAEEALEDLLSGKSKTGQDYSFKGILKSFFDRAGDAAVEGIMGQVPFGLGESRWLTTDWKSLVPEQTWTQEQIDAQLPVTPGSAGWVEDLFRTGDFRGIEASGVAEDHPLVDAVLRAREATGASMFDMEDLRERLKVYDSGGWLEPGGLAVNLSNRPEPIFSSPEQLRQFSDGLQEPDPRFAGAGGGVVFNAPVTTADIKELVQAMRLEQKRQSYGFTRR